MHRTIRSAAIAAAVTLLITPALAGCSVSDQVEQIIEGATGGEVDLPGASLPDGYPSDEVPLVDGDVTFGVKIGDTANVVYNVTVATADDPTQAVRDALLAAGFTEQAAAQATTTEGTSLVFTGTAWGVLVVVAQADGAWNANYTVTSITTG